MVSAAHTRLPRFRRAPDALGAMRLTERDVNLIRHVGRHRFLRSSHLTALSGESAQQILRRLQALFHHGYLDRPRAQLSYFHEGGSQSIVYGLGNRGADVLAEADDLPRGKIDWAARNREAKALYLRHTLAVADVMVGFELACIDNPRVRLVREEELAAEAKRAEPFRWTVQSGATRLGIAPDRVFALEHHDTAERSFYFLEADRATMPIVRAGLTQTSFYRKLVAYEATWAMGVHKSRLGFHRFRVLTVTSTPRRAENLIAAARDLPRGHGLFLFTDAASFAKGEPLSHEWRAVEPGKTARLV